MLSDNPAAPLILVVGDDDSHAELIRRSFESSPQEFRLCTVNVLAEARKAMGRSRPSLVLTDYLLPDGDGHNLVAMVNDSCPVIILASRGNEQLAVEAMKSGVMDYVVKSRDAFRSIPRIAQQALREWDLIQERRRLRNELIKAEKLKSLAVLAGGIAHDFNNVLTSIVMHVSLARELIPAGSQASNSLEVASCACEAAIQLSRRLISFTKGGTPARRAVGVGSLVRNCLLLHGRGMNIDLHIPEELHCVGADEGQLHQVFSNIILNASQAMPEGGRLSVLAENVASGGEEPGLAPGAYVRISIADEGCGIDEEVLPTIFDPYFTTKPEGNGLGLASSYSIVAQHGGRIFVSSRPGVGSVFTVYLPAWVDHPGKTARTSLPAPAPPAGRVLVQEERDQGSRLDS